MAKLDLPLRPWVPEWLGIVTAFIVMLPTMIMNGTYTGNMLETSGILGIYSEDITMGYYASSIGMAISYPIIPKVLASMTPKTMLLLNLFSQVTLCFFCAHTTDMTLVTIASFFIGVLKGIIMLWFISKTFTLFSRKRLRSEFYPCFYPIAYTGGQFSVVLTAAFAYYYEWKHIYYFNIIFLLVAIIFVLSFFRYAKKPFFIPYKEIDFRSILILSTALLMFAYCLCYGKVLDWFSSDKITLYVCTIPLLMAIFIWQQHKSTTPYLHLKTLSRWRPVAGHTLMMAAMMLGASSSLTTNYMVNILRVDNLHANLTSFYVLPGYILAGIVCYFWFKREFKNFSYILVLGMGSIALSFGLLYFTISPYSTYQTLYLPILLRGFGMLVLVIAFCIYIVKDMEPKMMLSNAFFSIFSRNILGSLAAIAIYNNSQYWLQRKYINSIAEHITLLDSPSSERYAQSLRGALQQGNGYQDAQQIATSSLYNIVQQQSTLLSLKTLFGYLLIISLLLTLSLCIIPWFKSKQVSS